MNRQEVERFFSIFRYCHSSTSNAILILLNHYLLHRDLKENFNGRNWGNNGPGVITRVLQTICNTQNTTKMTRSNCFGFHVLPIKDCYSISWPEYKKFFKEEYLNETMERINRSLIVHVWNKFSASRELSVDSKVAYIELAKQYCPKVIESCGKNF